MCLLASCMSSLEKYLFRSPAYVFIVSLLIELMSYFYVLEINPLLVASFLNIFSHSVGCIFFLTLHY